MSLYNPTVTTHTPPGPPPVLGLASHNLPPTPSKVNWPLLDPRPETNAVSHDPTHLFLSLFPSLRPYWGNLFCFDKYYGRRMNYVYIWKVSTMSIFAVGFSQCRLRHGDPFNVIVISRFCFFLFFFIVCIFSSLSPFIRTCPHGELTDRLVYYI